MLRTAVLAMLFFVQKSTYDNQKVSLAQIVVGVSRAKQDCSGGRGCMYSAKVKDCFSYAERC